jgi:hypothetical protein
MLRIGFTGTRQGMKGPQRSTVRAALAMLTKETPAALHHGDCVGADAQAHWEAVRLKLEVWLHPPRDPRLRAFCTEGVTFTYEPAHYLMRNRFIVDASDILVAAPRSQTRTGGTWYTIKYAIHMGKRVIVVWPDGQLEELRD